MGLHIYLADYIFRSRDAASPSQRCAETDEAGDILRTLLSVVEAVKTDAKFEKSGPQSATLTFPNLDMAI